MAYEHVITADWHDVDVFSSYDASVSRNNTTARTGSYSFRLQYSDYVVLPVTANATKYIGVGLYPGGYYANILFVGFRESGTYHTSMVLNTISGQVEARRGDYAGTLLGQAVGVIQSQWAYWGIQITVHDSTGVFVVQKNGAQVLNLTSQDTQNGATGVIDNIIIGQGTIVADSYLDDTKISTSAIPGVGGLYVLVPNANGSDTDWTASAGSAYECVDEAPATYTDYIYRDVSVLNEIATFDHAGLTGTAYDSIPVVCVAAAAKLDGSGAGNIRTTIDSNGTHANGSSTALSTTSQYIHLFQETDPDTAAAWTKAGVNAAEFGVETI